MPTNLPAAQEAIKAKFRTDVATPRNLVVGYDNMAFKPPQDGKTIFAEFSVLPGTTTQVTTGSPGSNRWRTPGIAQATIYAPVGSGDKASIDLASFISGVFKGVATSSGVTYRSVEITKLGNVGGYYQVAVRIVWWFDSIG